MDLIADVLLLSGALGAAFYCIVLSRRLTRFTDLEQGVGGAVAVLSVQVDELKAALAEAQVASTEATDRLEANTQRAEEAARRLELLIASSHGDDRSTQREGATGLRSIRRRRRHGPGSAEQGDAA